MIYKTLHKQLKIDQCEQLKKTGVKSGRVRANKLVRYVF